MAINLSANCSSYVESSSDDECLSAVKVKIEDDRRNNSCAEDSNDGIIMPDTMVTVEVEELDEACNIEFNKNLKLRKRKKPPTKSNKKSKEFPCNMCGANFNTAFDLKEHSLEHQVKTRHKCEPCNRYFKKAFSLRMHMKIHSEREELECVLCGQKFNQKNYLTRHMSTHERTRHCQLCDARFHTDDQLSEHMNQGHKDNDNEFSKENGDNTQSESDIDKTKLFMFSEFEATHKREDLSHSIQCAIVNKLHKGRSVAEICEIYHLTPDTVNEIWEEREKYELPKKVGKPSPKFMNSVLDSKILDWYNTQKSSNIQVTGKMLQDIAESFAKEYGFVAFNGSRKWLDRFKKRYNICLRGISIRRDNGNNMESKWKNHFFKEQWSDARLGIPDEDIYTADEFGYYYNPSKGRIRKLTGRRYVQGQVKDRMSVFLCANMPGTDKKRLIICGTEDPLIHSYRNPDTLPVTYIRHSQAHFTTQMFEEYVKYWNRELKMKNKTAILVLDRATIHSKLQLSHLKLVFVPWKASNGLIPMKNGVSAKFREEFRRLLIEEKAMNVLKGVDRNITSLEALYMFEKAWDRIPPDVITKSFVDTGYDVTVPEESMQIEKPKIYENDDEILCNMLKDYDVESYYTELISLDNYLKVDDELVTGQGTNGSVFGGNHKVDPIKDALKDKNDDILPLGTEKPDSPEKEVLVRKSRALQDLDIVKKYLQSNVTSYETFCCFMEVEKFVMESVVG